MGMIIPGFSDKSYRLAIRASKINLENSKEENDGYNEDEISGKSKDH